MAPRSYADPDGPPVAPSVRAEAGGTFTSKASVTVLRGRMAKEVDDEMLWWGML